MILKNGFVQYLKPLLFASLITITLSVHAAKGVEDGIITQNPWSFNITAYTWLPGVNGDFSAGSHKRSVDADFVEIAGKLKSFPLAFMGHFEAHYERLGFYMDGNYVGMDFKPKTIDGVSLSLSTELGIMDYGVSYRLYGPEASERIRLWDKKSKTNTTMLDVYTGGRSIWLGNQITVGGLINAKVSSNQTFTAPVLGAKVVADITPNWFVLMDGNVGGFGVDYVSFTGSGLGAIGYRTKLLDLPTSIEAGYKVLNVNVNKNISSVDVTLNGPFVGLTSYW